MTLTFGTINAVTKHIKDAAPLMHISVDSDHEKIHQTILSFVEEKNITDIAYSCLQKHKADLEKLLEKFPQHTFTYVSPERFPKVTIGVITYNSQKYISDCLSSLMEQDYPNYEIIVLDNASTDTTPSVVEYNFPQVNIIHSPQNLGFSKGHNTIINNSDGKYYACLNPDMIFDKDFISRLVERAETNPQIGSVTGKLKRWVVTPTERYKTNIIDSVGLDISRDHRFTDKGAGEGDIGQYNTAQEVFGASGAAVLYKREALDDISFISHHNKEYFDELFFAYKEDIDISYRFQWAGWKCFYEPKANAFHDRTAFRNKDTLTAQALKRSKHSRFLKIQSAVNEYILLRKNMSPEFSGKVKRKTWWRQMLKSAWYDLFEPKTATALLQVKKLKKQIKLRKENIKKRNPASYIESFMK